MKQMACGLNRHGIENGHEEHNCNQCEWKDGHWCNMKCTNTCFFKLNEKCKMREEDEQC